MPDEPEPLRLIHHHPGRLRMRADAFRYDEPLARVAAEAQPGVERVATNGFTGSLLVEYVPGRVEPGAILAAVADAAGLAGVVDADTLRRNAPDPAIGIIRAVKKVDALLREVSGGRARLGTVVPGVLLATAMVQLLRHPVSPRWDNLAYWGYSIFRDLHLNHIIREEADTN
jgi:Heavy metal associated domain 2